MDLPVLTALRSMAMMNRLPVNLQAIADNKGTLKREDTWIQTKFTQHETMLSRGTLPTDMVYDIKDSLEVMVVNCITSSLQKL
jgi:hypothetical protein